jgi:2-methylcitrate dehydratase PrpD
MTKGLGHDYLIMETYFKHWPTNMWIQQHLDLLDAIVKTEKINADDVAEVICEPNFEKRTAYKPEGYSGFVEAQFSIPYCVAAFLLDPEPGPNWYTEEKFKDPKLLDLAGRVKVRGPTVTMRQALTLFRTGTYPEVSVEIITKDGRHLKRGILFPKGHPKNRLTVDEYRDMFRRAASFVLKRDKTEAAIEKILKLEEVSDISEVVNLLHNE